MLDDFAILRRIEWVIDEHQTIRKHIKLVGDSVPDREALGSLRRSRNDWVPNRPEILAENLKKLQQTLGFLDDGLKNHFAFEGKNLPPLCGDLLMQALLMEHGEILRKIDETKSVVANSKLEGMSEEEFASQESQIQQVVASLFQLVEGHTINEEVILKMIRRVLEEKTKRKRKTDSSP